MVSAQCFSDLFDFIGFLYVSDAWKHKKVAVSIVFFLVCVVWNYQKVAVSMVFFGFVKCGKTKKLLFQWFFLGL